MGEDSTIQSEAGNGLGIRMYQVSALAIGVLISVMLLANGALQAAFGAKAALLVIHATGTLAMIPILFLKRAPLKALDCVPPYLFLAGAVGVALVFLNNTTVASIGLTLTIAFGVVGQLIASGIVDRYGLFGLQRRPGNWRKIAGLALILAGVVTMAWPRGSV